MLNLQRIEIIEETIKLRNVPRRDEELEMAPCNSSMKVRRISSSGPTS